MALPSLQTTDSDAMSAQKVEREESLSGPSSSRPTICGAFVKNKPPPLCVDVGVGKPARPKTLGSAISSICLETTCDDTRFNVPWKTSKPFPFPLTSTTRDWPGQIPATVAASTASVIIPALRILHCVYLSNASSIHMFSVPRQPGATQYDHPTTKMPIPPSESSREYVAKCWARKSDGYQEIVGDLSHIARCRSALGAGSGKIGGCDVMTSSTLLKNPKVNPRPGSSPACFNMT
ncbi:hypothetical protein Bbelb_315960 [Branchiostoma belcheri]|nr:hypothetical protein Bbelb_315960 [Branchiostoma belcheri]